MRGWGYAQELAPRLLDPASSFARSFCGYVFWLLSEVFLAECHEGVAVVGVVAAPWSVKVAPVCLRGHRSLELSLGSLPKVVCPEACGFPWACFSLGRPSRLPGASAFGAEVVLTMPPRTRWARGSLCAVGIAREGSKVLARSAHPGALHLLGTIFRLRGPRRALGG